MHKGAAGSAGPTWAALAETTSTTLGSTSETQRAETKLDLSLQSKPAGTSTFLSSSSSSSAKAAADAKAKGATESKTETKSTVSEQRGDLFSAPRTHSLAHCVSRDLAMGRRTRSAFF